MAGTKHKKLPAREKKLRAKVNFGNTNVFKEENRMEQREMYEITRKADSNARLAAYWEKMKQLKDSHETEKGTEGNNK